MSCILKAGLNLDSANTLAQLNALAQLQTLAAANPKIAAAAMLQLQQQHLLGQAPPSLPQPPVPQLASSAQHHLGTGGGNAAAAAAAQLQQQQGVSGMGGVPSMPSGSSMQVSNARMNQSRYQQLLGIIDEMGREIKTCYLGNKNSIERLKRGIASARILVKDCQIECEKNAKM